ncbi:uncharacterized protein Z518_04085 [Rhinocladiella mackenziei CBS 650.93]|uniref:Rhinocladiella mackenziei CBS 650.93 unplaced genomic scaffold supercont1.3, whole genome shotgun sequence n=1 Tax=Rhinocladiella mackenziei CBS 650.93 TaxID=1442369 RepID=A0A0D2ISJ3_9EURO|nr:uncharacterized protein Z518_04085 [Rhinocladiella mackenziei CBS 650.93]KIX06111.1 hypothetical protein Z518_04085 [Rhinocladiella mackenziei CBS 650.93]
MATNAAGPTTPPRLPATAPSAPAPARHVDRQRAKAPRVRAATENELDTTTIQSAIQDSAPPNGHIACEEAENTEYQPDTYITMISSVLARKLETIGGHMEGLNNNIGTNNTKTHALEKQITSFLTTVKNNEALTRTLLEASKRSETCTAELGARIVKLESQNNTILAKQLSKSATLRIATTTNSGNPETRHHSLRVYRTTLYSALATTNEKKRRGWRVERA